MLKYLFFIFFTIMFFLFLKTKNYKLMNLLTLEFFFIILMFLMIFYKMSENSMMMVLYLLCMMVTDSCIGLVFLNSTSRNSSILSSNKNLI